MDQPHVPLEGDEERSREGRLGGEVGRESLGECRDGPLRLLEIRQVRVVAFLPGLLLAPLFVLLARAVGQA